MFVVAMPFADGVTVVFTQRVGDDDLSHSLGTSLYYRIDFSTPVFTPIVSIGEGVVVDAFYERWSEKSEQVS